MYKYLLFSEPQSLVFYSSATALARHGAFYFAVTKMKQLIFRSNEKTSSKANIPLGKALQLSRTETVNLLKVVSLEDSQPVKAALAPESEHFFENSIDQPECENDARNGNVSSTRVPEAPAHGKNAKTCLLLLGTSKLNFYLVQVGLANQKILEIQKVSFGYKSSLKRLSSNSCLVSVSPELTLLVSANFIFYLTPDEPRFKLLKILKEKALSVEIDFQNKKRIYILGKKALLFGLLQSLPGGALSFKETRRLQNKRKFTEMRAMRKKLVFLNKHRQLRVYELDKEDFTYKIEIFQSFKQPLVFSGLHVVNGDIICIHDQKYLYALSLKMNQIWQILNLSDSHFAVLPDGQILTLQPKSENLFSVAQVRLKTYQKANKINKYLRLSKLEKLKVIFSYLNRKFLKLYKFQDYKKVIYDLLLKMNLSNALIRQPEFKAEVLKFYNLTTDFSLKIDRSAVKASSVRVPHRRAGGLTSRAMDSGSAFRSNVSEASSTSPSPRSSPSRKKNLDYMVVKPYVDIRLPRKNGPKAPPSDALIMEKIMVKGRKHYQKFLRFKRADPFPKDCIDSVYARYQSRLERIKLGKFYLRNIVRFFQNDRIELAAENLFFYAYKFDMKNNYKLLHSIFMGIDLWLWAGPVERKVHYRVLLIGIKEKNIHENECLLPNQIQKITCDH